MRDSLVLSRYGTNDRSLIVQGRSTTTSPAMDPEIWSQLPKELLEQILSFLPFRSMWKLRSTCKHFKSLLFSPQFMYQRSSSSLPSPFPSFLLLHHPQCYQRFALYDSARYTWRNLDFSLCDLIPSTEPSFTLLSVSKGLFCFSLPRSSSFLVCNLLAGTSTVVKFPTYPFAFEQLTLVSTSVGYKLFVLCTGSSSTSGFLYDSRILSWRHFQGFERILSHNYHGEGAYFDGCLYFLTPEPFSVVCFDLESGKWKRSDTELPGELMFVRLVSGEEGKLYMVGGVGSNGISRSLRLWELDGAREWVQVESLPEMMCRKLVSVCYHNYEHVYCFWHQGMICICCYTWPEILYFKVSNRTWHWLPKCPLVPERCSSGFRWFSFVPELYAPV